MIDKKSAIDKYIQIKNSSNPNIKKFVSKPLFPKVDFNNDEVIKNSKLSLNEVNNRYNTSPEKNINKTESAGLLKDGLKVSGYRKAAKFLMLVGKDEASEILKQLSGEEIKGIMREIATINQIDKFEADAILNEFKFLKNRKEFPKGGVDTARSILVQTMGEEAGRKLLKKVVPDAEERPFAFVNDIDAKDLYLVLKKESNDTIALIMQFIDPKKASEILTMLSDRDKIDIAKKVASRKDPSPMVISIVEEKLREKIRNIGATDSDSIDGAAALANILKYVDLQTEDKIIDELSGFDQELSKNVKEKIFTIDMITSIDDTDLQEVLHDYSDEALAIILKGKSREIENKILSAVSSRRALYIKDERERLGAMNRKDVDDATKDFLNKLRTLHYQNKIIVRDLGEEYI